MGRTHDWDDYQWRPASNGTPNHDDTDDAGPAVDVDTDDDHDTDAPPPRSVAELVSELLYAGKTLSDVAGYDDLQLQYVVCRPRDKYGALVRAYTELPPGVYVDGHGMRVVRDPQPLQLIFAKVKRWQGLSPPEAAMAWADYQAANPKMGVGGV